MQQSGTKTEKRLKSLRIDLRERESFLERADRCVCGPSQSHTTSIAYQVGKRKEKRPSSFTNEIRFLSLSNDNRKKRERKNNTHSHNTLLQIS